MQKFLIGNYWYKKIYVMENSFVWLFAPACVMTGLYDGSNSVITPPMLLALAALSTAQAAEPTGTLTLACKGTETHKGSAGTSSDQINIGVTVDFQKKIVTSLSDSVLTIDGLTETTISFPGKKSKPTSSGI